MPAAAPAGDAAARAHIPPITRTSDARTRHAVDVFREEAVERSLVLRQLRSYFNTCVCCCQGGLDDVERTAPGTATVKEAKKSAVRMDGFMLVVLSEGGVFVGAWGRS